VAQALKTKSPPLRVGFGRAGLFSGGPGEI
jgi:hypothetical protein